MFTDGINLASSFTNLIDGLGLKLMIGADGVPVENTRMCPGVFSMVSLSSLVSLAKSVVSDIISKRVLSKC